MASKSTYFPRTLRHLAKLLNLLRRDNAQSWEVQRNLKLDDIKKFGVDFRHFNGIIYKDNVSYNAVGFELAEKIASDYMNKTYNIVYYPEKIILNDEEVIQIILKSIKENK